MHEASAEVYAGKNDITISKIDKHIWSLRRQADKGDHTVPFAMVTQRNLNGVPLALIVFDSYEEYLLHVRGGRY